MDVKNKLRELFINKKLVVNTLLVIFSVLFFDVVISLLLGIELGFRKVVIISLLMFIAMTFLSIKKATIWKNITYVISCLLTVVIVCSAFSYFAIYIPFRNNSSYYDLPCLAKDFFSNKRVMVIVPHEDDDINLVSGIIDNYVEYGSETVVVFVTNGDYNDLGVTRINEAIECMGYLGVPESNVYFMGYGDQWNIGNSHIYNSLEDEPMTSAIGYTKTYGSKEHPAYHNGNLYTNRNYQNDLKDLILEIKPDVLYINDYDSHADHKAVSLMSEKVLGDILKISNGYQPIVYKGYAYSTAWTAIDDFYSINMKSTQKPEATLYAYNWEDRIRIPVSTKSLSRSVYDSDVYKSLSIYESQYANTHALRIINGDKVFWQRRTDSILFSSEISVSSGNKKLLTDFRILDNAYIKDNYRLPYDGVWKPDGNDDDKTILVSLNKKTNISQIVLYDHPSLTDNINNVRITFDDESSIETGQLKKNGSATVIEVNKSNIGSFKIDIISYEGTAYGLTEIEAFEFEKQKTDYFIKVIDSSGDFLYDYIVKNEYTDLSLYSNDAYISDLNKENYTLICDNDRCVCEITDNVISVKCPRNESCMLTITEKSSGLSDNVRISNPSSLKKAVITIGQFLEEHFIYVSDKPNNIKKTIIYRLIK